MGEEETPEEDAGRARSPGEEEDPQEDRGSTTDHMDGEEVTEEKSTGADIAMVDEVQSPAQTSSVESGGAVPLPKRAPAEKIKGAHTDDRTSTQGSHTEFVSEEVDKEGEVVVPRKKVVTPSAMDEDYE